jgi:hypothetical protein
MSVSKPFFSIEIFASALESSSLCCKLQKLFLANLNGGFTKSTGIKLFNPPPFIWRHRMKNSKLLWKGSVCFRQRDGRSFQRFGGWYFQQIPRPVRKTFANSERGTGACATLRVCRSYSGVRTHFCFARFEMQLWVKGWKIIIALLVSHFAEWFGHIFFREFFPNFPKTKCLRQTPRAAQAPVPLSEFANVFQTGLGICWKYHPPNVLRTGLCKLTAYNSKRTVSEIQLLSISPTSNLTTMDYMFVT